MSDILTQVFWTSVVTGGLLAGVPLMFTALGETISERAGVLNIGLEGMMLLGAYVGFLGAYYGHSVWVGYLAGIAAGAFGSLFMVVLCVWLGLDQIVVGKSLFDQPLIVYLGLAGVALTSWVFRKTNAGLNLRAAGEKPEALDAAGVSVLATRSYAALCTGALAGLGGAYLSIVGAGTFTPFMTQGQGFMAIVIAMLARGKPLLVVCGAFLFGISLSIATALQLAGINVSTDVVNMLPFLAIMVALVAFARRSYLAPALAIPYVRGAR